MYLHHLRGDAEHLDRVRGKLKTAAQSTRRSSGMLTLCFVSDLKVYFTSSLDCSRNT